MSAGAFTLSKYAANSGSIYPVRVQPETLLASIGEGGVAVTNAAPAGATDQEISAIVGGSSRKIGMHTRGVRLRFTGAVPDGYSPNSVVFIPALQNAFYNAATKGSTGTYLGVGVIVVGRRGEVAV